MYQRAKNARFRGLSIAAQFSAMVNLEYVLAPRGFLRYLPLVRTRDVCARRRHLIQLARREYRLRESKARMAKRLINSNAQAK